MMVGIFLGEFANVPWIVKEKYHAVPDTQY